VPNDSRGRLALEGPASCRTPDPAIAGHVPSVRISLDHDPLFRFHRGDQVGALCADLAPFIAGRLIETIRREYLDHRFLRGRTPAFRVDYEAGFVTARPIVSYTASSKRYA
jgi:hypothetical protein